MSENYRKSIASIEKLPQFTTMNVIDGQAGLIIYTSLIFDSLTIDNILNIIVLLILAGVSISTLTGENGLLTRAKQTAEESTKAQLKEELELAILDIQIEKTTEGKDFVREDLLELSKIGATIESTGIPAEGEYKDYYFEIDENYVVTVIGKLKGEKPTINGEVITTGIVATGGKVEIKVTASISEGTIEEILATNGAVLKTETSSKEKIFEVSENGKYYFKAKADNGRSGTVEVVVNTIMEAPEINIKDVTETSFTIVVTNDYVEGLVTEYKYYVGGSLKSSGTTEKEYIVSGLTAGTEYKNIYVEAYFGSSKLTSEEKDTKTTKKLVTSINLNKSSTIIELGKTETLTVTVLPENATDSSITWSSSNTSVATVTQSGVITAKAKGTATITVTANDGSGISASCGVRVKEVGEIEYSWEELSQVAKVISNTSTITSNTNEVSVSYNGKTYTLKVGDYTTVNDKKVRILGFNHDDLVDTSVYGGSNSKAGISFEYVDFITDNSKMNSTETNSGGWESCALRETLNGTLYDSIKSTVNIKKVKKKYCATYKSETTSTSEDYLWLLSCAEIWADPRNSDCAVGYSKGIEGIRYKYYVNIGAISSSGNDMLQKPSSSSNRKSLVASFSLLQRQPFLLLC